MREVHLSDSRQHKTQESHLFTEREVKVEKKCDCVHSHNKFWVAMMRRDEKGSVLLVDAGCAVSPFLCPVASFKASDWRLSDVERFAKPMMRVQRQVD